jgi:hypothetical protein
VSESMFLYTALRHLAPDEARSALPDAPVVSDRPPRWPRMPGRRRRPGRAAGAATRLDGCM